MTIQDATVALERARMSAAAERWADAYHAFDALELGSLDAEDLEAFADAAWWRSELVRSLDLRRRAYAAFEARGDDARAAAAAARLAIEHFVREEPSIGSGFLMRAHRHVQAFDEDAVEHGWLAVVDSNVERGGDPERAIELAQRAIASGRAHGDRDLTAMGISGMGLAQISAGRSREGIALLDEAMAIVLAGHVSTYFTGIIYCAVVATCLELGDVRRAGEWSDAARAWCESLPPDSPFPAMCRVNRAEVASLRGSWSEAVDEAQRASDELAVNEPGLAGHAIVQIGEILRRRGDLTGAEAAFARARELGVDPQPGLALIRLAERKVDAARAGLRLALADEQAPPRRARLLSALVDVSLAGGDVDGARGAADELRGLAVAMDLPAFRAAADAAEAALALANGDITGALTASRRACAAWQDLKLPYEAALSRVAIGTTLLEGGDAEGARAELRAALATFESLGASADAARTRSRIGGHDRLPGGLTAREVEVLRLVAAGKTNRDIAVELVISEHTVARHLQNLFAKIHVNSRAAATAYAFEHDLA